MYVGFWQEASGLAAQTAKAIGATGVPRLIGGLSLMVIPDTSAAATNAVILTGVVSGGGASGGQVSGLQFTIDPATQKYIVGNAIASGANVILMAREDGDGPVNP